MGFMGRGEAWDEGRHAIPVPVEMMRQCWGRGGWGTAASCGRAAAIGGPLVFCTRPQGTGWADVRHRGRFSARWDRSNRISYN